jgi:hypothetical protein
LYHWLGAIRIRCSSPTEPPTAEQQKYDDAQCDVVREVAQQERRRGHLQTIARDRLRDNCAQHIQRREIPASRAVNHHQPDHPAVNVVPLGQPKRERRKQRHARRTERACHCRQRRDDENHPRNQRSPSTPSGLLVQYQA